VDSNSPKGKLSILLVVVHYVKVSTLKNQNISVISQKTENKKEKGDSQERRGLKGYQPFVTSVKEVFNIEHILI